MGRSVVRLGRTVRAADIGRLAGECAVGAVREDRGVLWVEVEGPAVPDCPEVVAVRRDGGGVAFHPWPVPAEGQP